MAFRLPAVPVPTVEGCVVDWEVVVTAHRTHLRAQLPVQVPVDPAFRAAMLSRARRWRRRREQLLERRRRESEERRQRLRALRGVWSLPTGKRVAKQELQAAIRRFQAEIPRLEQEIATLVATEQYLARVAGESGVLLSPPQGDGG